MMDEAKALQILDFLSEKAKEFVQVSDKVLEGEKGLQAKDGVNPSEWQTCSTLSAFINYIAETERLRYGHFVCDLEKKNNEHKAQTAFNVLNRMTLFWENDEADDSSEEEIEKRQKIIGAFLENDAEIKRHIAAQPDMSPDVPQETYRDWFVKLRILGVKEAHLLKQWKTLYSSSTSIQEPSTDEASANAI